jgi:Flp pilus assembly protein TadG
MHHEPLPGSVARVGRFRARGRARMARRVRRSERGSVIVEAVIIIPMLLIVTFGAIEYGIAFRESAAIKAAARAGARSAVAMPRNDGYTDAAANAVTTAMGDVANSTPQELWIYHAYYNTPRPSTCSNECAKFTWDATSKKFVLTGGNVWDADQQNACASADDPNFPEQVGVYIKAQHKMVTAFFGGTKTLTANSVMRLEPYVGTGGCSP